MDCTQNSKCLMTHRDRLTDTSKTRALITLSDRHAGKTLGEIATQVATSGECELTTFAFRGIRFAVVHASALSVRRPLAPPSEADLLTLK